MAMSQSLPTIRSHAACGRGHAIRRSRSGCGASPRSGPARGSGDEARARLTRAGQPAWLVDSLLAIAAYQRADGPTETITSVVADLTGKPPRTFAAFARDHALAFLPARD